MNTASPFQAPHILPYVAKSPLYVGGESHVPGVSRLIKLSSNEAAFGPSPRAVVAARDALESAHLYPDGTALQLRSALSEMHGLPTDHIVCGLGSDELISLTVRCLCGPEDQVVFSQHGFLMYPISAGLVGAETIRVPERNMNTDIDGLIAACTSGENNRVKLVFVTNPNNPTGTWLTAKDIRRLHAALPPHVVLVLDLAYSDYMTSPEYSNHHDLALTASNVIVLHTFSKIYGLGGLRVGWGIGSDILIDGLNRTRGPFNIPSPSQAAATAALADQDHVIRERENSAQMQGRVAQKAASVGMVWKQGVANFGLFEFATEKKATACHDWLKSKGVLTRKIGSYGLPQYLRMSMGTPEDMEDVCAHLDDWAALQ